LITKPMLAATVESVTQLKFPLLATPKLDGIRCLRLHDGRVVTRSLKPIPNPLVRAFLEEALPLGSDGELYVPGVDFSDVQSAVMNSGSVVDVHYAMFDYIPDKLDIPYELRMLHLMQIEHALDKHVHAILPQMVNSDSELLELETLWLGDGHEGVMLRHPLSPYKCGRSTMKEQYLMKFKRMADSEAEVIGFEEKEFNDNEATIDALGHTKRSSHKANKRLAGTLGALIVRDVYTGVEFNIGTGFTDAQRQQFWNDRELILRDAKQWLVSYKYQVVGTKVKPRFPSYKGWRNKDDLSA
jgi:DNA ligase-1